jgi:hypothetical protein
MLNINNSLKNNLMERFDVRMITIVTGRSCHGASYWLTSPPNWEDNSFIDAASFRLLLKYSHGMHIILASQRCPDCNTLMDIYGDHIMPPPAKQPVGLSINICNSIVNSLIVQMKSASMNCSTEAKNLTNNSRQRPGDIFVPEFDIYGDAFLDVSVINTTVKSHIHKSSKGQLCGANICEG